MILFRIILCLLCISLIHANEESFVLLNGNSGEPIFEWGKHCNERVTPCSTFKIALSLMGYDSEILYDQLSPVWYFQEGYDDFLESWKQPQNPQTWMKNSCVWYSRLIAIELGLKNLRYYLKAFDYGNQDVSGGLTNAWLAASLKISPEEQAYFILKMHQKNLPVSNHAFAMTKSILFIDELADGWKLFGKTGWSGSTQILCEDGEYYEIGWFVGWIEKGKNFFPFAYNIRSKKINLSQRIPRVKELITELNVLL